MRSRIFYCMTFIVFIMAIGVANADIVGISITSNNPMLPDDLAGAPGVRVGNWNSWVSAQATLGDDEDIIDDSGAATGMAVTINDTSRFNSYFSGVNDLKLFGQAIDVFSPDRTITVTNVPYAEYDVYCYMKDDSNGTTANRAGSYTIGNVTYYIQGLLEGDGWPAADGTGYILSEDTTFGTGADIDQGNYCVFKGLTGDRFELFVADVYGSDGRGRNKFAGFQIVSAARGKAHTPKPAEIVISQEVPVTTSVSWYSPLQDKLGNPISEPNIVSVDGYDVWWSVGEEPNFVIDTPMYQASPDQDYTPAEAITYDRVYYWRVDTHVTWDSTEITGSLSSVVEGSVWKFTTEPQYTPPVIDSFDSVVTTVGIGSADLGAVIAGNSTAIAIIDFSLLTDDFEFPADSDAVLADDDPMDSQNPGTTLTTTVPGTYKVKLTVTDAGTDSAGPTAVDAIAEVVVYADACAAQKAAPSGWTAHEFDLDGNCSVDLLDFAVFAAAWLDDTAMNNQESYEEDAVMYVPLGVLNSRIEAEWVDVTDPNACSDGPIGPDIDGVYDENGTLTGIRIEGQATASNGQALGYASNTAWVEYTIDVPPAAVGVPVDVYAAHAINTGSTSSVTLSFGTEAASDAYGICTLYGTSGWTNFTAGMKIGEVIFTTAGSQVIRTSYGGGLNLDWFSFDW